MTRKILSSIILIAAAVVFCVFVTGCDEEKNLSQEQAQKTEKPAGSVEEKPAEEATSEQAPESAKKTLTVSMITNKGEIIIELNEEKAPITVKNFLRYVDEKFYDGTVFHRVIPGFMIQGGGFDASMAEKKTHLPIENESANGLGNERGTIAMASRPQPNSATSQFFINVNDNSRSLNYRGPGTGYAVFGKVIKGMDVADAIVKVPTTTKEDQKGYPLANNPVDAIVIESVRVLP